MRSKERAREIEGLLFGERENSDTFEKSGGLGVGGGGADTEKNSNIFFLKQPR